MKGLHSARQILRIHRYQSLFLILVEGQQTNYLTSILTIRKVYSLIPRRLIYPRVVSRKEDTSAAFLTQLCIRGGDRRKKVLLANVLQTAAAPVDSSTHTDCDLSGEEQGWDLENSEPDGFPVLYSQDYNLCPQCTHFCVASAHVHTQTHTRIG